VGVVELKPRPLDETRPRERTWRRRGLSLLREPLLHFFLVGLLVFVAAQAWRDSHDARRIVITPERVADLATKHRMQFGTAPSRAQLNDLVAGYVDEEVLYRQGVAQGLDRDDEIVRRRVAQKTQFLQQDIPPREPSAAQLRAFFAAHAADYGQPPRYTFTHVYLSPQVGGDAAARTRALTALGRLRNGAAPAAITADTFPDLNSYSAMSAPETARIFGDSPLVASLRDAPVGRWYGPVRSTYGWHLVRVDAVIPATSPEFAAVEEKVRADYFDDSHARASTRAMAAARARYTVVRADLAGGQ
jgi:peptidyl-prolyl cis-trans isomerase C